MSSNPDTAYVTSKGQVVVPVRIRRKFGIKAGTRLNFQEEDGRIVVQPVTKEYISSFRGIFKLQPGRNPPCRSILTTGRRNAPGRNVRSRRTGSDEALVFDASALLALLFDEPGAAAVESLMQRAAEKEQAMLMGAVNWAETCYRIEAKRGADALGGQRNSPATPQSRLFRPIASWRKPPRPTGRPACSPWPTPLRRRWRSSATLISSPPTGSSGRWRRKSRWCGSRADSEPSSHGRPRK